MRLEKVAQLTDDLGAKIIGLKKYKLSNWVGSCDETIRGD